MNKRHIILLNILLTIQASGIHAAQTAVVVVEMEETTTTTTPESHSPPPPWFEQIDIFDAIELGNWEAFLFRLASGDNATAVNGRGRSPLHLAAQYGELEMLRHLVEVVGGDVLSLAEQNHNRSALHYACIWCHEPMIKYLVEKGGVPVNIKNVLDGTPLTVAAWTGCVQPAKYLVEQGADLNDRHDDDDQGNSVLHTAVQQDYLPMLSALLEVGAALEAKNSNGQSPLHYSFLQEGCGELRQAEYLIGKGADVNSRDGNGSSVLHAAVENNCSLSHVALLVESGAELNAQNDGGLLTPLALAIPGSPVHDYLNYLKGAYGNSSSFITRPAAAPPQNHSQSSYYYKHLSLFDAARSGDLDAVRYRVSVAGDNASAEYYRFGGYLPLHYAIREGHLPVVRYFVEEAGVSPNSRARDGSLPLEFALADKSVDMLEYLIGKGANVTAADNFGNTSLHEAVAYGYLEHLQLLVDAGADVSAKDERGRTPLYYAAKKARLPILYFLVEHGAAVDSKDEGGRTPFFAAASSETKDPTNVLKYLFRDEADVKVRDEMGDTPLHAMARASSLPYLTAVKFLIGKGAPINASNKDGDTPLHLFAANSVRVDFNIFKYFVEAGAELTAKNNVGKIPMDLSVNGSDIWTLLTPEGWIFEE